MNHSVRNVQELYNSAMALFNNNVMNGDASADTILNNLYQGVENLKVNWKGRDAGVRIQEVIKVHNAMVVVRNALAQLAVDSSKIAVNYRRIQNANGARMEELNPISFELKTYVADYSDTADTVYISDGAESGKNQIDAAKTCLTAFESAVKSRYSEIMENWTMGSGRDVAQQAFESFISNANMYRQILDEVSLNITNALNNYRQ